MALSNPSRANVNTYLELVSGPTVVNPGVSHLNVTQHGNYIYAQFVGTVSAVPTGPGSPIVLDTILDSSDPLVYRMLPNNTVNVSVSLLDTSSSQRFAAYLNVSIVANKLRITLRPTSTFWPNNDGDTLSLESVQFCYPSMAHPGWDITGF